MHYVTGPGDVCFRFSEDKKPFEAARKQCESEGAQLVNDQSEAVYRFVQQHLEANPSRPKITWIFGKVNKAFTKWHNGYWVGARKTGGSFRWLDGEYKTCVLPDANTAHSVHKQFFVYRQLPQSNARMRPMISF